MTIRIVQLGSPRSRGEGVRIGTVRRPPRGIRKKDWAAKDYYDVWLPLLAPSALLLSTTRSSSSPRWRQTFEKRYISEMKRADASRVLDALPALSHAADFSVGCYCEEETNCHRRLLRKLLVARGAKVR